MSELSRKHHTVPRFYLERFADERNQLTQVWLPGDVRHPVSITKASVIRDFYSINLGTADEPALSDFWEKQFAEVETSAANAFRAVVDDLVWPPSPEHRWAIALWAALQHLRSPAMRNQQQDHIASTIRLQTAVRGIEYLREVMTEGLGREVGEAELEAEWEDLTKPGGPRIDLGAAQHIKLLGSLINPTTAMFEGSGWVLLRFRRRALMTSDTPVALLSHPDAHPMMGVGLATAGAFFVPLSRRVGLFITQPGMPDRQFEGTTAIARSINTITANNARRAIFHHPADDPSCGIVLHGPVVNEVDDAGIDGLVRREGWSTASRGGRAEAQPVKLTDDRHQSYVVNTIANTRRSDFTPARRGHAEELKHYVWPIPNRVFKNPHAPASN